MSDESLDYWIGRLNAGDVEAVERVLVAYESYLRMAVRRRLGRRLRSKVDTNDIVQSVFADVIGGFPGGGWQFSGRPQLQAFLKRVAWRRIADRYQKHGKALERERPLDSLPVASVPAANQPRASEVAQGWEFWERLHRGCPPQHRDIVRLRMDGFKVKEIAERVGLHEGSVRRVFYDLARKMSVGASADLRPVPSQDSR